ncbi:MAG: LysM peptidoglycan-binding domain-containing protein [Erysipelotrichales bacterium]|nr:LysM peptidoglycan-binding domain-containing protein [Erysipelotrichales bacterium]
MFSNPQFFKYVVRSGDTLQEIARRYQVDLRMLMQFNNLNTPHIHPNMVLFIPTSHHTQPPHGNHPGHGMQPPHGHMPPHGHPGHNTPPHGNQPPHHNHPETIVPLMASAPIRDVYVTRTGDTIESIASSTGVDIRTLLMNNDFLRLRLMGNQRISTVDTGMAPRDYSSNPVASSISSYSSTSGDNFSLSSSESLHRVSDRDSLDSILTKYNISLDDFISLNREEWLRPGSSVKVS